MLGATQPPWASSHRWLEASWLPPTVCCKERDNGHERERGVRRGWCRHRARASLSPSHSPPLLLLTEDGQHGCGRLPAVVPVEAFELPVLGRAGEAGQVGLVADSLEVSADEEEGDGRGRRGGRGALGVEGHNGRVNLVQVAVAAALDGDLVNVNGERGERGG